MVSHYNNSVGDVSTISIPQKELNWSSISLSEINNRDYRLEASVYDLEGRYAHKVVNSTKWGVVPICGNNGLASAYHRPRFKRVWVDNSSYPIYQPSQITELRPKSSAYISDKTNTDIDALRVKRGQILLTCSGTIGKCTIVTETLANKIFSHDLIRIECKDIIDIGYIYVFLKSKIGYTLINTNNYGAVISHIEPEHLSNTPIPTPPKLIKSRINMLIMESFAIRDKSNLMLDEAEDLLLKSLQLPNMHEFILKHHCRRANIDYYNVKLSNLQNRLEASYHNPIANEIIYHLNKHAIEVTTVSDRRISNSIILPGWFKRIYVNEGQGAVFIGGKQIYDLDPSNKKYLSTKQHKERIEKELRLKENMILITCSGTIGKVSMVPKHWENWTMNQHVIRIVPANKDIAGYLYVYLSSNYGYELINRFTYGSVVDEIDDEHVAQIQIPLIQDATIRQINCLALRANELRYKAYVLEQQALSLLNEEVLHRGI